MIQFFEHILKLYLIYTLPSLLTQSFHSFVLKTPNSFHLFSYATFTTLKSMIDSSLAFLMFF